MVVKSRRLVNHSGKTRRFHLELILAGVLVGGIAGTLFEQNLGLLFILSLDWVTLYGLFLADYQLAAYAAACAIGPVGFLMALIFSCRSQGWFQFWVFYNIGVIGANHVDVRYVVEYIIVPGFWEYVGLYTSASDIVNDAAATQPQF